MPINDIDDAIDRALGGGQAPAAPTPHPIDEAIDRVGSANEIKVRRSLASTADVTPDAAADERRLSLKFGVPPEQIRRNPEAYAKRGRLDRPYQQIQDETPKLASWLETPDNAAVSHDDLDKLGLLEWLVTAPQRAFAQTINQQRYSELRYQSMFRTLDQSEHDLLESYRYQQQSAGALGVGKSWFKGAITGTSSFLANQAPVLQYGLAGAAEVGAIGAAGGSILPGVGTAAGALSGAGIGFHAGILTGILKETFHQESAGAYDEYINARDEFGNSYDPQVAKGAALAVGAVNAIIEAGGAELLMKSFPGFAAFGAGEIAPRQLVATALKSPTFRAAVADAVKSYGVTLAGETGQEIGQRLFTILGNEAQKYVGKPTLATGQTAAGNIDLTQQPKVSNADGTVSTVDSLSVNIDGKEILLPTVTAAGEHFTGSDEERTRQAVNEYHKTGRNLGTFETPAAATAFAQQLHEDYASGTYDSPTHKLESEHGLETIVADLAQEGAGALQSFALGVLPGPLLSVVHNTQKAKAARQNAQLFAALGEGVTQSKTFERMPEAAQAFIAHATKDGPLEKVYAPIEGWTQYWQEKGIDPGQVAAEVTGSRDAYERAVQTGEDLEIPTARYATKLAATEHNAFFSQELRLQPGEMNAREAEAYLEAQKTAPTETPAAEPNKIREQLTGQLTEAGVPAATADSYATLYESVFSNLGERAGVAPDALYARYGLQVTREGVQGAGSKARAAFDASTAPLTPAEAAQLDRRQVQGAAPDGVERRAPNDLARAELEAETTGQAVGAGGGQQTLTALMKDPSLAKRGTEMRQAALAKGRKKAGGAGAVFLAHGPDGALYNFPLADGTMTTGSAESVEKAGLAVPETPADTGERLNGDQLRQRMLDAKAKAAQTTEGDTTADGGGAGVGSDGGPSVRGVEASTPPGGRESAKQRDTRRTGHYDAVFASLFDAAQRVDPSVDAQILRKELNDRIDFLDAGAEAFVESGHDPLDLLRTIAKLGGISLKAEEGTAHKLAGYSGEIKWLRESTALGPYGAYAGVAHVFRTEHRGTHTGRGLDDILTSIQQDARFGHLETINDLLAALGDIARMESVDRGGTFYGTDELRARAGVNPDVAWWNGDTGFNQSAYHGSPHSFEKFSLQAIGSGEGAQAYGWGLYFAGARETAEYYRDVLSRTVPAFDGVATTTPAETMAHDILSKYEGEELALMVAKNYLESGILRGENTTAAYDALVAAIKANAEKTANTAKQGKLYKVEIPGDEDYLDWDRPASKQSPKVQAALKALGVTWDVFEPKTVANFYRWFESKTANSLWAEDIGIRESLREAFHLAESGDVEGLNRWQEQHQGYFSKRTIDPIGQDIYNTVGDAIIRASATPIQFRESARIASEALAAQGVAGIRYLDGMSRASGEGSSNYVVFDDRLVQVEEFYQGSNDEQQGDLLDTGEEQARLPGDAGAVRDTENATPAMDAPFSLTSETSKAKGKQESLFQQQRGAIRFGKDRQMNIALFANADLSTFLHESGHFFLEVLRDLASAPDANATIKADLAIINGAFFSEGDNTLGHERFARAFEAYLMKGEAPSIALRSSFARFRAWLVGVYRAVKNLNVPMDARITGVMDRLVATDAAIADAQAAGNMVPLFLDAKTAGMSEREFSLYRRTVEDASKEAQFTLQAKLLAEVQREQTAAWKERRAELRTEVETEVQARPDFRALAAMQKGTHPNGESLEPGKPPAPLKLSKQAIIQQYGKRRLATLPRPYIYTDDETGLRPGTVAEMFGYSSGDEMLTAVSKAGNMTRAIETETDRRMIAEHGAILLDGTLAERAQAAAANETRDAVVRAEMRALINLKRLVSPHVTAANRQAQRERSYERRWFEAEEKLKIAIAEGRKQVEIDALQDEVDNLKRKSAGGPALITSAIPRAETIQTAARTRIAEMRIRDIRADLFWAAARKAQTAAVTAAAKQDFDAAILAQQQQLLNLALYREAEKALDDAETRARQAKQLATPAARARIGKAGGSFLEQVDGILERYEFVPQTGKALGKRAEIRRWAAAMEGENLPVDLPEEVLEDARRTNYSELTYDELVGVTDGLQQIVHLARLVLRAKVSKAEEDYAETRDGIVDGINAHGVKRETTLEPGLRKYKPARIMGEWFASHTKLASFIAQLDGYADGGPMWEAFMRPVNEAATKQQSMHEAAAVAMGKILTDHYTGRELGRLQDVLFIPALGASLSKEARLAVALNWGNEGNRQRLMESVRHWNAAQVQAILETLDERDLRFVQANLDYINSFWPDIEAKQTRVYGIAPAKVPAASWQHSQAGEQRGGYYPIAYDGRLSVRQGNIIDADAGGLQKHANYAYATTKRGYTKAREEKVNSPVRLELGVMYEHIEGVIHDLSHHEMLIDVGRLLGDRKVQSAIASRIGDIGYQQMRGALLDVALGNKHASTVQERGINWVKNGTTIAGLAWNFWTSVQQPLGIFNGAARVGSKWVAKGVMRMFRDASSMEGTARWVNAKSEMMRLRGDTLSREISDLRSTLQRSGSWFDNFIRTVTLDKLEQEDITSSFLFLIEKTQQLADLPVWIGGYEKAMAAGETEERAIALADQGVLDSQSGGQVKDLAQVQRGGPYARLFTAFYSYGNLIFNQTQRTVGQTNFRKVGSVGQMLANLSLIYVAPAAITVALAAAFGKEEPDDPLDFLALMGREMLSTAMNTMVLVRETGGAASLVYSKMTGVSPGGGARGYEGPTGLRIFSGIFNLAQQVAQGKADRGLLRAVEEVGGVLFHLPAGQVQRSIDGFVALEEGRTSNPAAILFGAPPKKTAGQ